jgi:hypothetical protein
MPYQTLAANSYYYYNYSYSTGKPPISFLTLEVQTTLKTNPKEKLY